MRIALTKAAALVSSAAMVASIGINAASAQNFNSSFFPGMQQSQNCGWNMGGSNWCDWFNQFFGGCSQPTWNGGNGNNGNNGSSGNGSNQSATVNSNASTTVNSTINANSQNNTTVSQN